MGRVGEEWKMGDEVILGGDLKVVRGVGVWVGDGMVVDCDKSRVVVGVGIGIGVLECLEMGVVLVEFVGVLLELVEVFGFVFELSVLVFGGWVGKVLEWMRELWWDLSEDGGSEVKVVIVV